MTTSAEIYKTPPKSDASQPFEVSDTKDVMATSAETYKEPAKVQDKSSHQRLKSLMEAICVILMIVLGISIAVNVSYTGFYRNFPEKYSLHKAYEWGPSNFHYLDYLNGYMTANATGKNNFWIINPKLEDRKEQEKKIHLDSNGQLKIGSCLSGESTPDIQTPFAICREKNSSFQIFMYQNIIVEPSTSQKMEKRVIRIEAKQDPQDPPNTFHTNVSGAILMQVYGSLRITPCTMDPTYSGEPDACSAGRSGLREKHILEYNYPVAYMGKTEKDLNIYFLPQDKTQSYLGSVINKGSRDGLDLRLRIVDGTKLFVDRHMISTLSIPSDLPKALLILQLVLAYGLVALTNRGRDLQGRPVEMPSNLIILSRMGISAFIVLQLAFSSYNDVFYLRIMVHLGGALKLKSLEMSCLLLSKASSLGIFMILLPTQLIKFVNARKRCDRAYVLAFGYFAVLFVLVIVYNLTLDKSFENGLQCRAQSGIKFTCYQNASCCTEAPLVLMEHLFCCGISLLTILTTTWYMKRTPNANVQNPNELNQFELLCMGENSSQAVIGVENKDIWHETHRYTSPYAISWMGFCKLDDETMIRRKDFYIALIQFMIIAARLDPHHLSLTMTMWSLSDNGTRVVKASHKLNSNIPHHSNWNLRIKPLK